MSFQETRFECTKDLFSCFLAFGLSPCLTAETVRRTTGEGFFGPLRDHCFCCCLGGACNAGKVRAKHGIDGSFINDCLCMLFCGPCSSAQLWREMTLRGD